MVEAMAEDTGVLGFRRRASFAVGELRESQMITKVVVRDFGGLMFGNEVVLVGDEALDVCVVFVEAKVEADFIFEPVVKVVRGDRTDGMLVVCCGPIWEG